MNASKELKKLIKQTGKPKRRLYLEMKIAPATFYNTLNKRLVPASKLFYEKPEYMKEKYGVK